MSRLNNTDAKNDADLRKWAVEQAAIAFSSGGGKPNHIVYVAADILEFVNTGKKPLPPARRSADEEIPF